MKFQCGCEWLDNFSIFKPCFDHWQALHDMSLVVTEGTSLGKVNEELSQKFGVPIIDATTPEESE